MNCTLKECAEIIKLFGTKCKRLVYMKNSCNCGGSVCTRIELKGLVVAIGFGDVMILQQEKVTNNTCVQCYREA